MFFVSVFNNCYGQLMEIIGLKVAGNYSAPFWTYEFSICLCERPTPNISMIYGFLRPVGILICGFC